MLKTKVDDPKLKNLPKIETNARLLHFLPTSFTDNFTSFFFMCPINTAQK